MGQELWEQGKNSDKNKVKVGTYEKGALKYLLRS